MQSHRREHLAKDGRAARPCHGRAHHLDPGPLRRSLPIVIRGRTAWRSRRRSPPSPSRPAPRSASTSRCPRPAPRTSSLSLTGVPEGWTASILGGGFVVDGVAVTSGQPRARSASMWTCPADATAGTSTLRVTAAGGGAQDVLPIAIRVNAEAAGDMTLTTITPTLTGASDASSRSTCSSRTTRPRTSRCRSAATGPSRLGRRHATLTGETQAASTVVEAGATQCDHASRRTRRRTPPAGTYPIKVEATAGDRTVDGRPRRSTVTGSYSMTLSTPNDLPLGERRRPARRRPRRSSRRTPAPHRSPRSSSRRRRRPAGT